MFGLFQKKEKPVPVTDLIWINDAGKKAGFVELLNQKPAAVLCAWFSATAKDFENFLETKKPGYTIYLQRELHTSITNGKELIFLEHYPLFKKEQELFRSSKAAAITVLSSMEDPLLKKFGGNRISFLMKRLGINEEEAISHTLITSSIINVQQKLDKQINSELLASSAEEWFNKNRPVN